MIETPKSDSGRVDVLDELWDDVEVVPEEDDSVSELVSVELVSAPDVFVSDVFVTVVSLAVFVSEVFDIVLVVVVVEFDVLVVDVFVVEVVVVFDWVVFSDVANIILDKQKIIISDNIVTFINLFLFISNLQVLNIRL